MRRQQEPARSSGRCSSRWASARSVTSPRRSPLQSPAAGRRDGLSRVPDPRGADLGALPARVAGAAGEGGRARVALAMVDPTDAYTIGAFGMVTGRAVRPMVAIPTELETALERLYGAGKSALGQIVGDVETRVDDVAFDADVQQAPEGPRLGGAGHPDGERCMITKALGPAPPTSTSSRSRTARVRFRIDGVLHEVSPADALSAPGELAAEDHGEPRHRRAPAAAGRPHPAARPGQDRLRVRRCPPCTARSS